MRYLAITIILSALVAMYVGIRTLDHIATREAQIVEYEFMLADLWKDNQDCREQLGVFYTPPTKGGENGNGS